MHASCYDPHMFSPLVPRSSRALLAVLGVVAAVAVAAGCGGGAEAPSAEQMKALALTGLSGQETRLAGPPTGWTSGTEKVLPKHCWPKSLGDSIQAVSDSQIAFGVRGASTATWAEVEVNVLAFPDDGAAAEAQAQIEDAMRECIKQGAVAGETATVTYTEGSIGGAFAMRDSTVRTQEQIDRSKALGHTDEASGAGVAAIRRTGRYVIHASGGWEAPSLDAASFGTENSATIDERVAQALDEQVAKVAGGSNSGAANGGSATGSSSSGSDSAQSDGVTSAVTAYLSSSLSNVEVTRCWDAGRQYQGYPLYGCDYSSPDVNSDMGHDASGCYQYDPDTRRIVDQMVGDC